MRLEPLPGPPTASPDFSNSATAARFCWTKLPRCRQDSRQNCSKCCRNRSFSAWEASLAVTVNIRILAATNVDIEDAIKQGKLRLDLYYRLNAFNVCLPPLRERREEIAPLFRHYMKRLAYSTSCRHVR